MFMCRRTNRGFACRAVSTIRPSAGSSALAIWKIASLWPQLMKADEVAFSETSTENALLFVVPTDRKWVRDLCVARIVHDALVRMNPVLLPDEPTIAGTVVV